MSQQYTIRQLADDFDVTTRTLRFYEEKGLLSPVREGQTRLYSSADRTRLKLILRGRRLGLSLDESSDIILMYNGGSHSKIHEKREQLARQQRDIEQMLTELESTEAKCVEALEEL